MTVVQLRHYTVAAANRDLLISMIESTVGAFGARVVLLGAFRDLDDERGVVCLHGLDRGEHNQASLDELDRVAITATQARLVSTILLCPGWEESSLTLGRGHRSAGPGTQRGVIELGTLLFAAPVDVVDLMYFCDEVAPLIQAARGSVLACLVQRPPAPDTAGEHGKILIWLAGFPWRSASTPTVATADWISEALKAWPGLSATLQLFRLEASESSAVTAASASAFRPIHLVPRGSEQNHASVGEAPANWPASPGGLRWPSGFRRRRRTG